MLDDRVSDVEPPQPLSPPSGSTATGHATSLNEAGLENAARFTSINSIIPASRMDCGSWLSVGAFIRGDFSGPGGEPVPSPPEPEDPPSRGADAGGPWGLSGPGGQMLDLPLPEPRWFDSVGVVGATREPGFLAPGEWAIEVPGGSEIGPIESSIRMPQLPEVALPPVVRIDEPIEVTWPATAAPEGRSRASVQLSFRLPADPQQPNGASSISFSCPVSLPAGGVTFPFPSALAEYSLEGVDSMELTFAITSFAAGSGAPAADRIDAEATARRSWFNPAGALVVCVTNRNQNVS